MLPTRRSFSIPLAALAMALLGVCYWNILQSECLFDGKTGTGNQFAAEPFDRVATWAFFGALLAAAAVVPLYRGSRLGGWLLSVLLVLLLGIPAGLALLLFGGAPGCGP